MSQILRTEPAYAGNPGVTVTSDGVIISAVLRGTEPCGLILYNISDGRSVKVPFTDEFRFGSLYSVRISPLNTSEWGYRLYRGAASFVDPCCRSLIEVPAGSGPEKENLPAGGFYYEPDEELQPFRPVCEQKGSDGFIYCLHVKGFTMLADGLSSCPGTFSAAAEKADYLKELQGHQQKESQLLGLRKRLLLRAEGGPEHTGIRGRTAEGICRHGEEIP